MSTHSKNAFTMLNEHNQALSRALKMPIPPGAWMHTVSISTTGLDQPPFECTIDVWLGKDKRARVKARAMHKNEASLKAAEEAVKLIELHSGCTFYGESPSDASQTGVTVDKCNAAQPRVSSDNSSELPGAGVAPARASSSNSSSLAAEHSDGSGERVGPPWPVTMLMMYYALLFADDDRFRPTYTCVRGRNQSRWDARIHVCDVLYDPSTTDYLTIRMFSALSHTHDQALATAVDETFRWMLAKINEWLDHNSNVSPGSRAWIRKTALYDVRCRIGALLDSIRFGDLHSISSIQAALGDERQALVREAKPLQQRMDKDVSPISVQFDGLAREIKELRQSVDTLVRVMQSRP